MERLCSAVMNEKPRVEIARGEVTLSSWKDQIFFVTLVGVCLFVLYCIVF